MKIVSVEALALRGATPDGGWAQGFDAEESLHTLIRVGTDAGLVGWGSCFTSGALIEAALELLRPYVVGQCALEPERVSETLLQATFWQGRGGTVAHAVSGIDIALWDILGKTTGQPVARLLGGVYRERVQPYASLLFADPPVLKERIRAVRERGFTAIKLGWSGFGRVSRGYDAALLAAAREAAGSETTILVDAGGSEQFWPHGYKWALETSKLLADYGVAWFEEALPPDDIDGYCRLRDASPVPIASGEVLTRRQSFLPWIERGALDIVQPDTTKCGGLSEARRIAWAAYDHNIGFVSHGWNTALGLAADLHLAAALPVARFVEYLPAPYVDGLVATPWRLDDEGYLAVPLGPGLGIEIDEDALERFTKNG